ncbi:Rop family plasmid primer RNA-binding protein, partial [Segatella copri]|uniref:Rop family plasmid primer RNA-binding protein n=1 Tax=Segatella copri TaxID=165179 RepID=UPI003F593DD3
NAAGELNELDADEQADICESLHNHADELYRSYLARFGDDGEKPLTYAAPGDGHSLSVSDAGSRQARQARQQV